MIFDYEDDCPVEDDYSEDSDADSGAGCYDVLYTERWQCLSCGSVNDPEEVQCWKCKAR